MRQQAEILEHHADAPAQRGQRAALGLADLGAHDGQPSAGGADREVQQAQQAGLAGAGRAEQPAEAALREC